MPLPTITSFDFFMSLSNGYCCFGVQGSCQFLGLRLDSECTKVAHEVEVASAPSWASILLKLVHGFRNRHRLHVAGRQEGDQRGLRGGDAARAGQRGAWARSRRSPTASASAGMGREAAQTTVISLLRDYFGTPDTWDTTVALDRMIGAQNAWLAGHNRRAPPAAA